VEKVVFFLCMQKKNHFLVYDVTGNYLPLISFFQFPNDLPTLLRK